MLAIFLYMYFPDRGCVHTLLTLCVYATGRSFPAARGAEPAGQARPVPSSVLRPSVRQPESEHWRTRNNYLHGFDVDVCDPATDQGYNFERAWQLLRPAITIADGPAQLGTPRARALWRGRTARV